MRKLKVKVCFWLMKQCTETVKSILYTHIWSKKKGNMEIVQIILWKFQLSSIVCALQKLFARYFWFVYHKTILHNFLSPAEQQSQVTFHSIKKKQPVHRVLVLVEHEIKFRMLVSIRFSTLFSTDSEFFSLLLGPPDNSNDPFPTWVLIGACF